MKIALASDLHLEFEDILLKNTEDAEVLLLAGDICVAKDLIEEGAAFAEKSKRLHDFFKRCCFQFPLVIYTVGNHEHYHGDFKYTVSHLKEMLGYLTNLIILDTEAYTHGDVTFIGGTLWTDMNKEDSLTLFHVKRAMSDYHVIQNSNHMVQRKVPLYEMNSLYTPDGKNGSKYAFDDKGYHIKIGEKIKEEPSSFDPLDTVEYHKKMLDYIKIVTKILPESTQKYIVVGHHAPSKASTHPRYKEDVTMNGAYSSDLSDFILDRPQIKLWVHGHTHDPFDYMIGSTRIVCNPRGYYGHERVADHFKLKYMEI
jgi:Icc-related predicted phosphoesterase